MPQIHLRETKNTTLSTVAVAAYRPFNQGRKINNQPLGEPTKKQRSAKSVCVCDNPLLSYIEIPYRRLPPTVERYMVAGSNNRDKYHACREQNPQPGKQRIKEKASSYIVLTVCNFFVAPLFMLPSRRKRYKPTARTHKRGQKRPKTTKNDQKWKNRKKGKNARCRL